MCRIRDLSVPLRSARCLVCCSSCFGKEITSPLSQPMIPVIRYCECYILSIVVHGYDGSLVDLSIFVHAYDIFYCKSEHLSFADDAIFLD